MTTVGRFAGGVHGLFVHPSRLLVHLAGRQPLVAQFFTRGAHGAAPGFNALLKDVTTAFARAIEQPFRRLAKPLVLLPRTRNAQADEKPDREEPDARRERTALNTLLQSLLALLKGPLKLVRGPSATTACLAR